VARDLATTKKGLARHVRSRSQTCLVNTTGIRQWTRISSERLRKFMWPRHVRAGGWTCPILVTGIRLGNRICPDFSREFGSKEFFDDLHFINSPNASPLIVRSS
jgi:hypothetical protein